MTKEPCDKKVILDKMMQFSGICNGQTANKTIQELKKEKAILSFYGLGVVQ